MWDFYSKLVSFYESDVCLLIFFMESDPKNDLMYLGNFTFDLLIV